MNGGQFPPYTPRKPYGSCPHCKRAIEPHGLTCVYCKKPYIVL